MNITKSAELIKKYAVCPECGNKYIANGEGGLVIEDYTFDRWCKCGWRVHVDIRNPENEVGS